MNRPRLEALWARVFAIGYEPFLALAERSGLRKIRRDLIGMANGYTVEIGAGSGLNLPHYGRKVSQLLITEPDIQMVKQIRRKAKRLGIDCEVTTALGSELPCESDSVDTVVVTMVLCTAPQPELVIEEIKRILKPGGQLLIFEHVRSSKQSLACCQDRLARPWSYFGRGCQPNRESQLLIESSGLDIHYKRLDRVRFVPPIVQPLVIYQATKPTPS